MTTPIWNSGLAEPTSRLGQLQRGRGAGFLQASNEPLGAADEVLRCILTDPRLDPQVESRARYYAELVLQLAVPIEPILQAAEQDGTDFAAVDVLAELVLRHGGDGLAMLVRRGATQDLQRQIIGYLRDYPAWAATNLPAAAVADLADALHAQDDLVVDVEIYPAFWRAWSGRVGGVAEAFAAAAAEAAAERAILPPPSADPSGMPTAALLDLLEAHASREVQAELLQRTSVGDRALLAWRVEHGTSARMFAAAEALGQMGDPRLLELAEVLFARPDDPTDVARMLDVVERSRRAALSSYAASLPPNQTLPLARTWWHRGGYFATAAARILARHAEPADRSWLEDAVMHELEAADPHWSVDALTALGRIGDARSVPVFAAVFAGTPSSFVRSQALVGLCAHALVEPAPRLIAEALWDCESDTRELAVRHVVADTEVLKQRLRELEEDPFDIGAIDDAAGDAG